MRAARIVPVEFMHAIGQYPESAFLKLLLSGIADDTCRWFFRGFDQAMIAFMTHEEKGTEGWRGVSAVDSPSFLA